MTDPIDALLTVHGLRRTSAARMVLGWLLAHPEIRYTHAQLQAALQGDSPLALGRVTRSRLITRRTQVGPPTWLALAPRVPPRVPPPPTRSGVRHTPAVSARCRSKP